MLLQKNIGMGVLALALGLGGCLTSEEKGPSNQEIEKAEQHVDKGRESVNATLVRLQDGDFQYGKQHWPELRQAKTEFDAAKKSNPGNSEARFGSAIVSMGLAVQSDNISDLLDRAQADSPFDPDMISSAGSTGGRVLAKVAEMSTFPEFHEFQDAVADSVLPHLDEAITDLAVVWQDPAFSLSFTFQDETRTIDRSEAGLLLAGFKILRSWVTMVLAYDVDIDEGGSYDFIEVLQTLEDISDPSTMSAEQEAAVKHVTDLLSPGSPFLTARSKYADRLAKVNDEILEAATLAKEALNLVKTDTQAGNTDLLVLCSATDAPECVEPDEIDEFSKVMDSVLKYAGGPVDVYIEDIDSTLKLNPAAFLGKIQDYKKLLPYYAFYDASEWSEEKPVLYFTNAQGVSTGDFNDLMRLDSLHEAEGWDNERMVTEIRKIIYLQDATFQGFLPGATEDSIWNLILRLAEADESQPAPMAKQAAARVLRPGNALALFRAR